MNQAEQEIEEEKQEELSDFSAYAGKENIVNTRIDERLIHGQVAGIWSTSLGTQRIIVANDEAASDPLQKSSLRMAAPSTMRLSVLPVETAAKKYSFWQIWQTATIFTFQESSRCFAFCRSGWTNQIDQCRQHELQRRSS